MLEHKSFLSFLFFGCLAVSFNAHAQNGDDRREPVTVTAGIELRGLVPLSFFTMDSVVLREPGNQFEAVYRYKGGFGFGGVVRVKLSNFWNIETGLYYTRRRFEYEVRDATVDFKESTEIRIIGYEVPIKGLVYIRMGKQIYMNVALGVSADFFASDVMDIERNYNVQAFKLNWIRGAVLGAVGVEFRTDEDGSFYVGGGIHQAFGDIFSTQVNYFRDNTPPAYFSNGVLDGNYFSIDFKYFFPVKESKKPKVNYVRPDWRNMK